LLTHRPDLKPENVLICIDDVEAVISSELASALAQPLSAVAGAQADPTDPSKVRVFHPA
jgi:hypothetical protein